MSQTKNAQKIISELFISKRLDKILLDDVTVKALHEFQNIIQTIDDEEYIEEEMEEVLSKKVQSQQYKNLLSALNFSFDDLSKTSKETIQTISQICAELKIREPSEDFILTELIALENEEDELQSTLQDLQEKNKFYKQVEENISSLLESSNSHLEHLEQRIKESEENARTIEDRVNDILEPKSAEYSAQIKQMDKKGVDYPADKENTYERVEFLHKKMLALEHSIEDVMSNYGDMASIPTTYEEALQILERKKAKALELEQKLNLM